MLSFALTKFQELANATNGQQAANVVFANPVLLAESTWPELADWVQHRPPTEIANARRALGFLTKVAQDAMEDRRTYPVGNGPLEAIIRPLLSGEINEAYASQLASRPEVVANLSPVYVSALSMRNQIRANGGDWQPALLAQKVLLAAVDARKSTHAAEQDVLEMIVAVDYAVVVARSIWEFPDGRLFRDAVRRVEASRDLDSRPWHEPGEVEFSLGVLHLDPYIYQRTTTNFEEQIGVWMRRPVDQLGPKLSEEETKALVMPEPVVAFQASSKYFRASANKRTGSNRGLSLKGHIEAEVWTQVAGGRAASNLDKVAREAKSLLADERYVNVRAQIDGLLNFLKQGPADSAKESGEDWLATAKALLKTDTAELVKQRGLIEASDFLIRVASLVSGPSPASALALWQKALPLVLQRQETIRKSFFALGLKHIQAALAHPNLGKYLSQSPLQGAAACRRQAGADHWPPRQLVATLLFIAVNSQKSDQESEGVKVLELAANVDPAFTTELLPLFHWLSGILERGIASNGFKANRYEEVVRAYAMAAHQFLNASLPEEAEEMLLKASDIVDRFEDQLDNFAAYFSVVIPELQRQGGTAVVRRMHNLCRKWIPLLAKSGRVNVVVLMLLLDAVKGSAFASELRGGGTFEWVDSDESCSLLDQIEQTRKEAGEEGEEGQGVGMLTDDDLLTMYAEDQETRSGDTPDVVLHNLEVRYDAELHRRLGGRPYEEERWVPIPDNIRAALGPETALISYYSGIAPNGDVGLYVNVFTSDETTGTIVDFGIPGMQVTLDGILADVLALGVTDIRRKINEDPAAENEPVSTAARKALESQFPYIKGPIGEVLGKLRKNGKWHLCIQPHGPLHFFPFHLLLEQGALLAENWTVTYLPNLALLDPSRRQTPLRETPIASFGVDFKNGVPHKLPDLSGAEQEAQQVALAYHSSSITGNAATEEALTVALSSARRIHIASHGLHNVSAPSFQRIYLWPDSKDDGILFAYELLRYDLRGLDLMTLSACETSLGRIDIGDNLRGMSASALIAGTGTVIGALWPVENTAAMTFFDCLHRELAKGTGKRESFRIAQTITRSKHPQYRDWGTFCYAGTW